MSAAAAPSSSPTSASGTPPTPQPPRPPADAFALEAFEALGVVPSKAATSEIETLCIAHNYDYEPQPSDGCPPPKVRLLKGSWLETIAQQLVDDLALAYLDPGRYTRWVQLDLHQVFDPAGFESSCMQRFENGSAFRRGLEQLRNAVVLLPILLTWFALSQASANYATLVDSTNPVLVAHRSEPFLVLWQHGFYGLIPKWQEFYWVAGFDAALIAATAMLTIAVNKRSIDGYAKASNLARHAREAIEVALWRTDMALLPHRATDPLSFAQHLDESFASFNRQFQVTVGHAMDTFLAASGLHMSLLQAQEQRLADLAVQWQSDISGLSNLVSSQSELVTKQGEFVQQFKDGCDAFGASTLQVLDASTSIVTAVGELSTEVSKLSTICGDLQSTVDRLQKSIGDVEETDRPLLDGAASPPTSLTQLISSLDQTERGIGRKLTATTDALVKSQLSLGKTGQDMAAQVERIQHLLDEIAQDKLNSIAAARQSSDDNHELVQSVMAMTAGFSALAVQLQEIGDGLGTVVAAVQPHQFQRLDSAVSRVSDVLDQASELSRELERLARQLDSQRVDRERGRFGRFRR